MHFSNVDLPAALGPTSAVTVPGTGGWNSDASKDAQASVRAVEVVHIDGYHSCRRFASTRLRKNGMPTSEVMMPIGSDPRHDALRDDRGDCHDQRARERRPGQEVPLILADQHPRDVRPHQPDEPNRADEGDGRR